MDQRITQKYLLALTERQLQLLMVRLFYGSVDSEDNYTRADIDEIGQAIVQALTYQNKRTHEDLEDK